MEPLWADVRWRDQKAARRPSDWSNWRWHLDEVFVRINGETHYLWRAVDHEGECSKFSPQSAGIAGCAEFLKRYDEALRRAKSHRDRPTTSYGAAMKVIGVEDRQLCGQWLNNRAENSHQPFRRRESAMARFRDIKTLQKFAAAHASIHNHFNQERHLYTRENFKLNRSAALAEWRQLAA